MLHFTRSKTYRKDIAHHCRRTIHAIASFWVLEHPSKGANDRNSAIGYAVSALLRSCPHALKPDTQALKLGSQTLKPDTQAFKLGSQTLKPDTQALKLGSQTLKSGTQTHKPDRTPTSLSGCPLGRSHLTNLLRMRYPEQRSICRRGNGLPASSSSERDATRKPSCS